MIKSNSKEPDSDAMHFGIKSQLKNSGVEMLKRYAAALALMGSCVLATTVVSTPASALETYEAQMKASDAASQARIDMVEAFGPRELKPGQYVWRDVPDEAGPERVVISLSDQMAYVYRGDTLMAATTISSGRDDKPTPTGIFSILGKTPMYRSKKYDNAPMPYAEFFEPHGIALHAGYVGSEPNSHGCVHLPSVFAKKLYGITDVGTPVYIGA
jgi:lipoprotein-anchoring transpeptidase ErfK/SrfK